MRPRGFEHKVAVMRKGSGRVTTSFSERRQKCSGMHKHSVVFFVTLFLLIGIPAYGYGDPSGGALFQMLMPMLAALWGMWLIFANRLRRRMSHLMHRLRGTEPVEPAPPDDSQEGVSGSSVDGAA